MSISNENKKDLPNENKKDLPNENKKDLLNESKEVNNFNKDNNQSKFKKTLDNIILTDKKKNIIDKENQNNTIKSDAIETFFQLNTYISKFVFILLSLIIFITLFNIGLFTLQHMYGIKTEPYLLKGLIDSNKEMIISSNPNMDKSVPILRSVNETSGIEYTWSIWFFVEDPFLNENQYKKIFSKGKYTMLDSLKNSNYNIKFINNSPGLYYDSQNNSIKAIFNVFTNNEDIYELVEIDNIPVKKWVSTVITVKDKEVEIYINGILKKSHILQNIPKQNYYDTYIGDNHGFGGYLSNLKYYDYSINDEKIQSIMSQGPNLNMNKNKSISYNPPLLSMNWYYN